MQSQVIDMCPFKVLQWLPKKNPQMLKNPQNPHPCQTHPSRNWFWNEPDPRSRFLRGISYKLQVHSQSGFYDGDPYEEASKSQSQKQVTNSPEWGQGVCLFYHAEANHHAGGGGPANIPGEQEDTTLQWVLIMGPIRLIVVIDIRNVLQV